MVQVQVIHELCETYKLIMTLDSTAHVKAYRETISEVVATWNGCVEGIT